MKADKRMLLTATPYVNNIYDFAGLVNLLHGKNLLGFKFRKNTVDYAYYLKSKNFTAKNTHLIIKFLKGHVDYIKSCRSGKLFPKVREVFLEIPMSKSYAKKYNHAEIFYPKAHRFYHGYRKAVNEAGKGYYSEKLDHIIPNLKGQKSVIYTNWLTHGVKVIEKLLEANGVTYSVFQGSLTKKKRQIMLADFNANKFQVLIITRAGGEGIDLKGVRNMIILDPVWHDAGLQQVIGRVVRYKSHVHLPPNQRNVTIWKLVLVPPSNKKPAITSKLKNYTNPTGDLLLYKIIKRKSDEQKQVDKILKACEI